MKISCKITHSQGLINRIRFIMIDMIFKKNRWIEIVLTAVGKNIGCKSFEFSSVVENEFIRPPGGGKLNVSKLDAVYS